MSGKLTHIQNDILKEIGNIGAGNATTSMADLMNKQIKMDVPDVYFVSINELIQIVGGPEEVFVTTFFTLEGAMTGTVYFLLSLEEATSIAQQLLQSDAIEITEGTPLEDMAISVIKEVANMVAGAYVSALADFTQLEMRITPPLISIDMAAATLVTGLIEMSQASDYSIMIDTSFTGKDSTAQGHFLLVPDLQSIPTLFAALGLRIDE